MKSPSTRLLVAAGVGLFATVAAIAGAGAEPRRHLHRMHQSHAEHADVEVDRHLHVVGVQCEVVDAAGQRPCVVHRRMLAVIVPVMQVGIVRMPVRQGRVPVPVRVRLAR